MGTSSAVSHRHRDKRRALDRIVGAYAAVASEESAPSSSAETLDKRLLCLGDDADGKPLEVMAVEGSQGELIVIHAMEMRVKYRDQHEEAKQWRL